MEAKLQDGSSEAFPFEKVIEMAMRSDPGDLLANVVFAREVDQFTVKLDQGTHEALHYGGGPGKGGGWWNEQIMKTLTEREAALERRLTPQEIETVGKEMMSRAKISDLPIVPYKEAQ